MGDNRLRGIAIGPERRYSENVTRRIISILSAASLCLGIFSINVPLGAEEAPTDCCQMAQTGSATVNEHPGCPANSSQEKQCCAACSVCLVFVASVNGVLLFPPASGERMGDPGAKNLTRNDRPPVPPPRGWVA
jgi:hypothetical protein